MRLFFLKNKEKHFDFVSGAGVSAIKSNNIKKGKKLPFKSN